MSAILATVNIDFNSNAGGSVRFRLMHTDGRLVEKVKAEVKKGENTTQIDVSFLPAGLYWIDLSSDESKVTKRLVIVRP